MKIPHRFWTGLALALLFSGCASTPSKRIQQNQELFNTLPIEDQARIRGGQIDLGYTADMVRIAIGDPQRALTRRTNAGDIVVWIYTDTARRYERQRDDIVGLSLSGPGSMRSASGSAWINVLQERETIRLRVEFIHGRVSAIEEAVRDPAAP